MTLPTTGSGPAPAGASGGVVLVGDVHAHFGPLARLVAALPPALPVLQVGDLAAYPGERRPGADSSEGTATAWAPLGRPLYFVWGNHDYVPALRGLDAPSEVLPGLVYLPAGVHVLGGLRVGVLGGAESVDGPARSPGVDWWPAEEGATAAEFDRLLHGARDARGVDLLVTHTPPASVVAAMLRRGQAPAADEVAEAPADAPSAIWVEQAWRVLGQPPLVCGHMHRPWREGVIEVLPFLGVTLRTLHGGRLYRPAGLR